MKKIILALAFIAMPTTAILANNGYSLQNLTASTKSVSDSQIEKFFKAESFLKISKTFNVKKENFDIKTAEIIKINETLNLIRLKVNNESRVDYVTLMPNNDIVLYEKTLINQNGNGNIEQYDDNGILIANFKVKKQPDGKFNVKLSFINQAAPFESQLECIKKTYDFIKSTCDKDTTCSISYDIAPNCAVVMYGVAAAHCAASGNTPPKKAVSTLSVAD